MAGAPTTSSPGDIPSGPPSPAPDDLVDLPSGKGYRVDSANELTRRVLTNVILFAGTAESGKTTLLASLYLMFHKKPFGNYLFAGSTTLVGFETRVHSARISSGLDKPTTERSKFSELLHLRVRPADASVPAKDLLLCDLWGEDFREARDSTDGCRRLDVIRRADAFVLLIDGAKLAQIETRQQAKFDPIALLRNVLDCGMLGEMSHVDVLTTKWDLVLTSADRADTEAFAQHTEAEMRRHFAHRVGSLKFSRVAAHPQEGNLPLGFGLEELFRTWVAGPIGAARHRLRLAAEPPDACEYDRYLARRLPRLE
jgi:hypothetical protein